MKHQIFWLLAFVFFLFACSNDPAAAPVAIERTPAIVSTRLPAMTPDQTPTPEIPIPASPTMEQPTATDIPASPTTHSPNAPDPQPGFHDLHFTGPGEANPRTGFPAGTEEIFAVWFYENMGPDDLMGRTWLKDGEVWLEREESWDSTTYGPEGMISAVSIYDFEDGLDPGDYMLKLKINGQIEQEAGFTIGASNELDEITQSLSSETRLAMVLNSNRLIVEDMNGSNRRELALVDQEIVDLRWFSDGRHLLFVEVDRSEQIGSSTIGVKHALWLVDVISNQVSQLSTFEENLHSPLIPFGNGYMALFKGSGYGDACFVDRQLQIMVLDENLQRTGLYGRSDFLGAPVSDGYWIYPIGKLSWIDNESQLKVSFEVTCADFGNSDDEGLKLRGEYLLDMSSLTAERIGKLPLPNSG